MILLNISKSNRSFVLRDGGEKKVIPPTMSLKVSDECGKAMLRPIELKVKDGENIKTIVKYRYPDLVDAEKYESLRPLAMESAEKLNALLKENEELKKRIASISAGDGKQDKTGKGGAK
ncbi:MAG: hypothetical protein KGJ13_04710 [Patescibacteria group bacterium]|nr:hypothetical protein [Patescibacteria group bacterium]